MSGNFNGVEGSRTITIKNDIDVDFEYFALESRTCDGTLSFYFNLMGVIFEKLARSLIYNKKTLPSDWKENFWNYNVEYVVGDFVLNEEFGNFGTEEEPWLRSKITVMLPIKMSYLKKEY